MGGSYSPGQAGAVGWYRTLGWTLLHPVLGADRAGKMGERMRAMELKARVLPSLLAGTSRHPLGLHGAVGEATRQEEGNVVLRALSLTGQALRFEKPRNPQQFSVEPEIRDDRRILPDRARRPLIRLLTGR